MLDTSHGYHMGTKSVPESRAVLRGLRLVAAGVDQPQMDQVKAWIFGSFGDWQGVYIREAQQVE